MTLGLQSSSVQHFCHCMVRNMLCPFGTVTVWQLPCTLYAQLMLESIICGLLPCLRSQVSIRSTLQMTRSLARHSQATEFFFQLLQYWTICDMPFRIAFKAPSLHQPAGVVVMASMAAICIVASETTILASLVASSPFLHLPSFVLGETAVCAANQVIRNGIGDREQQLLLSRDERLRFGIELEWSRHEDTAFFSSHRTDTTSHLSSFWTWRRPCH